jgi:hypothetical protein
VCCGAGVLWHIAPRLVVVLIAYATLGTYLTTSVFGRKCAMHVTPLHGQVAVLSHRVCASVLLL